MLADLLRTPRAFAFERHQRRGRLDGKVAIVTGGDSPLARAVAVCLAHDGADVVLIYREEHGCAREALRRIKGQGVKAMALFGELDDPGFSRQVVEATLMHLGHTDLPLDSAEHASHWIARVREQSSQTSGKSAIASFGSALASHLAAHGVRVKAVAQGPVWSPLVPTDPDTELPVNQHHGNTGPCFVFLARNQTTHPNADDATRWMNSAT
jgi:NAD(P)-dependent dehydrogenase (short-subunit alcohol dehydrogenase family)